MSDYKIIFLHATRRVKINKVILNLHKTQYDILAYLYFRRGAVVSKSEIYRYIHQDDFCYDFNEYNANCIRVQICRINKKINNMIKCLYAKGYCIEPEIKYIPDYQI